MSENTDPLIESAPLAWRLSGDLCRRDAGGGEDCAWQHGLWQYLRLMGLVGSIESRADFYREAFKRTRSGTGAPRVLVSGAADYAMLALALQGFRQQGVEPDITVVDTCETPLALNRWYAGRSSCVIDTARGDILDHAPSSAYDVVCTDAFFGRFEAGRRSRLVAKWHELLRPGGLVVTANHLRPGATGPIGFSPAQALELREATRRIATEMRDVLQRDPDELATRAEVYAQRHFTYPVGTPDEIRGLFEHGGFTLDCLVAVIQDGPPPTGGPSTRARSSSLRVVARRT